MDYIKNSLDFHIEEPSVISLGKFDGLHMGHRYLMEAINAGKQEGLKSIVFTFDIPPKAIYEDCYKVLSTNEEKMHIFTDAGVDVLIECPFTEEFRKLSPYDFLKMLTEKINIRKIVAGTDFCFGYQRSGTYRELQKYADEFGYEAVIVKKKQYLGADISSTRIREAIALGDMETANHLLGYDYFVTGEVLHGNEIGRTIGIPTANIQPIPEKLLPPNGVYAVRIEYDNRHYFGISNIGYKPTIEGTYPLGVETFIFDFSKDIYGEVIKVSLSKFLRPEQKFVSLEELSAQMHRDVEHSKAYFREHSEE